MRPYTLLFFAMLVLYGHGGLLAQVQVPGRVISAAGHSGGDGQRFVSSTLGESVIFSATQGAAYLGQGFQTLGAGNTVAAHWLPFRPINVHIYPNPSAGPIHIESEEAITELRWFAEGGRLAGWQRHGNRQLDLSSLPAGTYFLQGKIAGRFYPLGQVVKVH